MEIQGNPIKLGKDGRKEKDFVWMPIDVLLRREYVE